MSWNYAAFTLRPPATGARETLRRQLTSYDERMVCTTWISTYTQQDYAMARNFGRILRPSLFLFGVVPQIANA
jgi:hypothetical protein